MRSRRQTTIVAARVLPRSHRFRSAASSLDRALPYVLYIAGIFAIGAALVLTAHEGFRVAALDDLLKADRSTTTATPVRQGLLQPTSDAWANVNDPAFWARQRASGQAPWNPPGRVQFGAAAPQAPPARAPIYRETTRPVVSTDADEKTYRTVCVRLCDGYFWPVSYATTEEHFERDRRVCDKSCAGGARLFVARSPGTDPDDFTDLKGSPYRALPTALKFRTNYDAMCRCRANAWEAEAQDQHRIYQLDVLKRRGDRHAAATMSTLEARVAQAQSRRETESRAITLAALSERPAARKLTPVMERRVEARKAEVAAFEMRRVDAEPAPRTSIAPPPRRSAAEKSSRTAPFEGKIAPPARAGADRAAGQALPR